MDDDTLLSTDQLCEKLDYLYNLHQDGLLPDAPYQTAEKALLAILRARGRRSAEQRVPGQVSQVKWSLR